MPDFANSVLVFLHPPEVNAKQASLSKGDLELITLFAISKEIQESNSFSLHFNAIAIGDNIDQLSPRP